MNRSIDTPSYAIVHVNGNLEAHDGDQNDYETIRAAVRGYIEAVPLTPNAPVFAWCNEEGKLNGMLPNLAATHALSDWSFGRDIYFGPVMVTGPDDGKGGTHPLSDDAWQAIRDLVESFAPIAKLRVDEHLDADYEDRQNGG